MLIKYFQILLLYRFKVKFTTEQMHCCHYPMANVLEATILTGNYKGEVVIIPRISITPTDLPLNFKRLQFPVRRAFAMTIDKTQGQSLKICGINSEYSCFSHGQLYVAYSRDPDPDIVEYIEFSG